MYPKAKEYSERECHFMGYEKRFLKEMDYTRARRHEFRVCLREFRRGKKRGEAFPAFFENQLHMLAHSIEKGLGLRTTEPGRGSEKALRLLRLLRDYVALGFDTGRFPFRSSLRTAIAYVEYQRQFDTAAFPAFAAVERACSELEAILGKEYITALCNELRGGAETVKKEQLLAGTSFDFEGFISSRRSMRSYDKRPIEEETILRAVEIANLSPSACNRQPTEVYFANAPSLVEKIDELITGTIGFKGETPNFLVVTTDTARFHYEEQMQWYLNGGIYLSHLVLALHSLGIGSCIMQWKAFYRTEKELKNLLGISDHEAIIAVIGCGHYREETRCSCAQRKSAAETLHICK